MSRSYSDIATEALIIFAMIFGPWSFGAAEAWSIWVLNWVGFTLGAIWLAREIAQVWSFLQQAEPLPANRPGRVRHGSEKVIRRILLGLTVLLLLYCLIGAVNARADYDLWHFTYRPCLFWLPHSYDQARSWEFFWKYLALAGFFWGMRDWLLRGRTRRSRLPACLQRILWVLFVNGVLLASVGLVQKLTGENKLLWMDEPEVGKSYVNQFGPFAYRGNGAQYFNLLWPVVLAFWLYLHKTARRENASGWVRHRGKVLLAGLSLMILCPLVSLSRTGAVVLLVNLLVAAIIIWFAFRKPLNRNLILPVFGVLLLLLLGCYLEWDQLSYRFGQLEAGYVERMSLFIPEWQMALDNQPFGIGPGTFSSMYQFYRPGFQSPWWQQAHNDWLEAIITVGWIGLLISLLPFLVILSRCFYSGGIKVRFSVISLIWVALAGCLIHALVDFPFQLESILVLFTLFCSLLSTFSKR